MCWGLGGAVLYQAIDIIITCYIYITPSKHVLIDHMACYSYGEQMSLAMEIRVARLLH